VPPLVELGTFRSVCIYGRRSWLAEEIDPCSPARAGLEHNMAPHRLRHFLFTWLKTHGIDDALIQPYSGHHSRTSLEIYSKISLGAAQDTYEEIIDQFPL
jgi:site-specific recombinase XerD